MGLFFLTSRGSGVRIPQLPHKTSKKFEVFFCFHRVMGSPVILRDQLPPHASKKFGAFLFFIGSGALPKSSGINSHIKPRKN